MHQATTMLSSTASARTGSAIQRLPRGVALAQNLLHIYLFSLPNMARHGLKAPGPVFSCNNSYKLKTMGAV